MEKQLRQYFPLKMANSRFSKMLWSLYKLTIFFENKHFTKYTNYRLFYFSLVTLYLVLISVSCIVSSLFRAVKEDEPFLRMKKIVKWYLSGFYKKPKGLKKPYNPILGETFRCYWQHPNGSKTYYIAEQVSHHPPISTNYVTNR